MLRSAAKNHRDVFVVCDPVDYDRVLLGLSDSDSSLALRRELALKVFKRTSNYDKAINEYLEGQVFDEPNMDSISGFPPELNINS